MISESTKNYTILIIDDEIQIRRLLKLILEKANYNVIEAENAIEGINNCKLYSPDAIFLDLGLPDLNGYEVLTNLRTWTSIPIIIISVQDQDDIIVKLLNDGADDFISKPFSNNQLLARLKVALRHLSNSIHNPIFTCDNLKIDFVNRSVISENQEIKLTSTEYSILSFLAKHAGKVLTYKSILKEVWGDNYTDDLQSLRVHINQIRKKINLNDTIQEYIKTESGIGYRMREN